MTGGSAPTNSLQHHGTPQEFGNVATFVLAPAASYITGS
jgi:hypothetical protein